MITVSSSEPDFGQAVVFSISITDPATNALADAATATLQITQPDSTVTNVLIGSLTHVSTGTYTYTFTPTQDGTHLATIVSTVPSTADDTGFTVRQPIPGMPTVQTFKNYLNATNNTGLGGDDELRFFLDSAVGLVDYEVDKLFPVTRTEQHHGGRPAIVLDYTPSAVSSVTEILGSVPWTITAENLADNTTWGPYTYTLYGQTLTRRVNGFTSVWSPGRFNILVTYTAGRTSIPTHVENALYELAMHLFKSQTSSRLQSSQEDWSPDKAYAMANRVRELLEPVRKQTGIG